MIFSFPNYDSVHLAISSGIVPEKVVVEPTTTSRGENGEVLLEGEFSRGVIVNLKKIGVGVVESHEGDQEKISCWLQVFPIEKECSAPVISDQTPILFLFSNPDDLPTLVMEMLRLGNDRQSFRWFGSKEGQRASVNGLVKIRVLLRVIGPPYYTLLRALERTASGTRGDICAYWEKSPGVWVKLGYTHPVLNQIKLAEKQFVLLNDQWVYLKDEPYQDIYDILQFKLPASVEWIETPSKGKVEVPLKLVAGNSTDLPEFWIIQDTAVQQLDTLVRDSDEKFLNLFKFAIVTDRAGEKIVLLRAIPSKSPPKLPINAIGFKQYWKIPNLFVPVGKRVHPTLRRDTIRKILAGDADKVVWLRGDETGYVPQNVPDSAFRLLSEYVDYVIADEKQPISEWVNSTRFEK